MAIRQMVRAGTPGAFLRSCQNREDWYVLSHEGLVLSLEERNEYHDSDFIAIVWDAESGTPDRVTYATTRAWCGSNDAWVDATPEVRAAADVYYATVRAEAERREAQARAERREAQAKVDAEYARVMALKGLLVRTKGSKTNPSLTGTLFWVGRSGSAKSVRVGVKDAAGQITWTSSKAVQAV